MKAVVRWPPKLKRGKPPGKNDIIECKPQVPLGRLACMAAMGGLFLIGLTSAMLAISGGPPKKSEARKLDAAEFNGQHMQQDAVDVGSKPANLDPSARSTSGYPSSLPTPGLVIKDPPGTPYQPRLTRKSSPGRFGMQSDAREWRFERQPSVVARRPRSAPGNKRNWPKTFIMYLKAHQGYLRKALRYGQTDSPNTME